MVMESCFMESWSHGVMESLSHAYLAERKVNLSDGVVPGEAVVVEHVQVQHARLQLVDGEPCKNGRKWQK